MAGLDELLNDLVQQLPGLLGIVCADRDGVVLSKVYRPDFKEPSSAEGEESIHSLSGCVAQTTEQASKLHLGENKTITSFYNDKVVIHVNSLPLVITLICSLEADLTVVNSIIPSLKDTLQPLTEIVGEEVQSFA